jgi:hypothetical protein
MSCSGSMFCEACGGVCSTDPTGEPELDEDTDELPDEEQPEDSEVDVPPAWPRNDNNGDDLPF